MFIGRPIPIESVMIAEPKELLDLKGVLECERPNADLHTFRVSFDMVALHMQSTA